VVRNVGRVRVVVADPGESVAGLALSDAGIHRWRFLPPAHDGQLQHRFQVEVAVQQAADEDDQLPFLRWSRAVSRSSTRE
jgi:hypothetical protein